MPRTAASSHRPKYLRFESPPFPAHAAFSLCIQLDLLPYRILRHRRGFVLRLVARPEPSKLARETGLRTAARRASTPIGSPKTSPATPRPSRKRGWAPVFRRHQKKLSTLAGAIMPVSARIIPSTIAARHANSLRHSRRI